MIQSAGLLALALGRAIGVDVWLSRGAGSDERGPALAPTIVLAAVSVTSVWALFVIAGSDSMNLTVYALAAAGFVVLDVIRTMLMHDGASWISVSIQIVTLSFVLIAAFPGRESDTCTRDLYGRCLRRARSRSRIHASGTARAVDQVLAHSPI